jgi:hypothetical protein
MRGSLSNYHTSVEQEKKVRSRLREERHAALCVLMDRELLTMQSLAAQEVRSVLFQSITPRSSALFNANH